MPSPRDRPSLDAGFGAVLRTLRLQRGLSQEALAHACGRHPTYISLLERGKNSPSLRTLFLLADGLGVKAEEIVQRVEAERRRAS